MPISAGLITKDAWKNGNIAAELTPGLTGAAKQLGPGVLGIGNGGPGVEGLSQSGGPGLQGIGSGGPGVQGSSDTSSGVDASSNTAEAIHAETQSPTMGCIAAFHRNPNGTGAAIYAEKTGPSGHAGYFAGPIHVTGDITTDGDVVLNNADCAEDFNIADPELIEPGMVMVLDENGALVRCRQSYDRRVAGVVSGAGKYRPAIVLDKQPARSGRLPISLVGKVYCRVDASNGPIAPGDLLTTSTTPGHAMRLSDPARGFGASLGKALEPHREGCGLIPILIALQ
jgi:hypothetical protein